MPLRRDPVGRTPRFTIVSAVYNVAPYLDDFIASIEAQDFPLDRVQIVLVDDGSTDGSTARLEAWQAARPNTVTVVPKANGGQASARNLGLEHATGEWVTFTDPDDMLEPDALSEIDRFLEKHPKTMLAAMNRVLLYDATGRRSDHPLSTHFRHKNELRNLDEHPGFFYGSAPCAFFRRDEIVANQMRFSEEIRPSFEDGYFCDEYLLRATHPNVGFVRTATYVYRKRADASSTLNRAKTDVERYTTLLDKGYLAILREGARIRGRVPEWLQTHILYELSWLFGEEERAPSSVVTPVAEEVHAVLGDISRMLDERVVQSFGLRRFLPAWRDILTHGYRDEPWHTPFAIVDRADMRQRLLRIRYRCIGERPRERILVDGVPTSPIHEKIRSQQYFQRTIVRDRLAWVPYGAVRVELDGAPVDLVTVEPDVPRPTLEGWRARNVHDARHVEEEREKERIALDVRPIDKLVVRLARSRAVRKAFRGAWVLVDRLHDADDSAEHLFRHLRTKHRKINAWFVIERGTPHDKKLRRDGYRRVIPYGSLRWKLLMLNCDQLISSHADLPIMRPKAITRMTEPRWRFVFLQHGVTKDDLSEWLNPKKIDIFVVSTRAEYHSLVDDDTAYDYTTREAKLTGLPRFDRILEAGARFSADKRDLILVAPTWRHWLVTRADLGDQRWLSDVAAFRESEYGQNWLSFLMSRELADLAAKSGLHIGLLMHPNQQSVVRHLGLPPSIELLDFDNDVRTTFARARVMVTDYSSMAFNVAYIERPVVYFQFDRDRVLGGQHIGRRGYFDYARDGFGPVTLTAEAAVAAVRTAVTHGAEPAPEYLARVQEAFPSRDGRCCERVTEAIRASVRAAPRPSAGPLEPDSSLAADVIAVDEAIAEGR